MASDLDLGPPAPTDPTNDYRVPMPRACVACGSMQHGPDGNGSATAYVRCLERHLVGARESLRRALASPKNDRMK
jgi:hypothetical protein